MRKELIDGMIEIALKGQSISSDKALQLESFTHEELDYLFIGTDRIRDKFKGEDVKICSIVNAKSGRCVEDCSFCAQSSSFKTCLLYTSPSPRDGLLSRMPSSA